MGLTWGFKSDEVHAAEEALDKAERELESNIKHYSDDPRKSHRISDARRDRDEARRQLDRARRS